MSSPTQIVDLSDIPTGQETTAWKALDPDALLSLRMMFLLLDAWDRKSRAADPDLTHALSSRP
jgi:hypothetical protein